MYGAWETYHVSNTHHNLKFRTPELVYVTQTGPRTTDVGGQKSSLNKLSLLYSITITSLSNTITLVKLMYQQVMLFLQWYLLFLQLEK